MKLNEKTTLFLFLIVPLFIGCVVFDFALSVSLFVATLIFVPLISMIDVDKLMDIDEHRDFDAMERMVLYGMAFMLSYFMTVIAIHGLTEKLIGQ